MSFDHKAIYAGLDIPSVIPELIPSDEGKSYKLSCPNCGKREAFIYKGQGVITCNRKNNCGYVGTIWDYIQTRDNRTQQEVGVYLSELAGVECSESDKKGYAKTKERRALSAVVQEVFVSLLEGKPLEYLKGRGLSTENIKAFGLGWFDSQLAIEQLKNKGIEAISDVSSLIIGGALVLDYWYSNGGRSVTIPIYAGQSVVGWWLHNIDGSKYKYLPLQEVKKDFFFGWSTGQDVVLCEGLFDSILGRVAGLNAVALGGADITAGQLEFLQQRAISKVYLCLDNDEAGKTGTKRAIEKLDKIGVKSWVFDDLPNKDIADVMQKDSLGSAVLSDCKDNAISGGRWLIRGVLNGFYSDMPTSEKSDKLIECHSYFGLVDMVEAVDVATEISEAFNIPISNLAKQIRAAQEVIKTKEQIAMIQDKRRALLLSLSENIGNDSEYKKALSQLERLEKTSSVDTTDLKPVTFADIQNYIIETGVAGVNSGYGFDFPLGALSIVAGSTQHGKTTLMLNMLVNMIQATDKAFYFFSFEESKQEIILKILLILANLSGSEIVDLKRYILNNDHLKQYGKAKDNKSQALDNAIKILFNWLDSGRLVVVSENSNDRQLCDKIHWIKENCDNIGGVFVDYIQVIKPSEKAFSRQLELQRMSINLRETAKDTGYPIILGAQFNRQESNSNNDYTQARKKVVRLSNIREAGDIGFEASLVLGLWNCLEGQNECSKDGEEENKKPIFTIKNNILEVHFLKSRQEVKSNYIKLCYRETKKIETMKQKDEI